MALRAVRSPEACVAALAELEPRAWLRAIDLLAELGDARPAGAERELRRVLGAPASLADFAGPPHLFAAAALGRALEADTFREVLRAAEAARAGSPFTLLELELLPSLAPASLVALALAEVHGFWLGLMALEYDPGPVLARDEAYASAARGLVEGALLRLRDLHAGASPYAADRAFSLEDARVIARAVAVAALRDDAWLRPLFSELLGKVVVAPTAAATLPSQSLAIALGHIVEAAPTPEGVSALREAIAAVRHAGVKKKLSRNLKPAERALGERPEVALRMVASLATGPKSRAVLAATLEAGFWHGAGLGWDTWCGGLAAVPAGEPLARALVWRAERPGEPGTSFVLDPALRAPAIVDVRGAPVAPPEGARVTLWHPLTASEDEREGWRSFVRAHRLRQPFRQVFREWYTPGDGEAHSSSARPFAGHVVSVRPLLGLARREGWRIAEDVGLARTFGSVEATLEIGGRVYPGAEGWAETGSLRFAVPWPGGARPVPVGDVPAVAFSEVCRAVDLLVSTSAFALDEAPAAPRDPRRLEFLSRLERGTMANMRRAALRHAFVEEIAAGRIVLEERHARVGAFAVHLATGRVTRSGAPVEVASTDGPTALGAVPWLPHDEALLERIARTLAVLLHAEQGPPATR